jgi:hypothetical protein
MEFLLGISLFINLALMFACGCLINSEKDEKRDLLNRLMAKDYKEYAVFEARKGVADYEKDSKKILSKEQDIFPVD